MEKEFVPYELSVKLKELGFNYHCLGVWNNPKGDEYIVSLVYSGILHEGYINDFDNLKVMAPLWQQAFDWFVGKGFFSSFDKVDNSSKLYYDFSIVNSNKREYNDECLIDQASRYSDWVEYDTPYKARQACLEKLITLI